MADKVINIGNNNNKVTVNVTDKIVCPTFDGTATKVGHKLSFGNKTFDGSSAVILSGADLGSVDLTSEQTIIGQKTFSGETYLDSLNANTGLISGNLRVINGIAGYLTGDVTGNLSGNASTATKLQTARTLTIGNTGKSFDGSSNVSWTLSEIGAASFEHTHSYLPLNGGTITGTLNINRDISAIHYNNSNGVSQGWLGFSAADTPAVWMANGSTKYNIIHSGNIGSQNVNYATSANGIASSGRLDSQEKIDNFITANRFKYATFKTTNSNNVDFVANDGIILSIPYTSTDFGAQIAFDDATSATVKVRGKASTWGNWYTLLHSGNYNKYAPKLDGTGASGTWSINISGNAISADNATLHNGYTIVQTNGLTHTIRDFTLGTLVRTNINYNVTTGDAFYVEIKGNTYSEANNSCFTQIQGYIYNDTIIAYGVTHLGVLKITPITAMNIDGKLCFWFPRLGYWMGFDIRCYTGTNYAINTVTSIENSADPGGTKRVTLTTREITSYHSGNLTSSVISNLGILSNNISGNAATATNVAWSGVTNKPNFINSFGTKTGDITIRGGQTGNGSVNLAMSNNELQASIVGLGSNAYTSTAYLPLSGSIDSGQLLIYSYGTGASEGAIQIREQGSVHNSQTDWSYAPRITFHWSGRHINSLGLRSDGQIAWGDQPIYHTGNLSPMTTSHPANSITKTNIDNWNAVHTWYTTATANDTTNTIDTWKEIEAFVSSFNKGDNLATYLANNYLAKSGGTMTGRIVCNYTLSNQALYTWRNLRQVDGGGGRSDSFIVLQKADGSYNAGFGTYGNEATDKYIYIGYDTNFKGLNLKIGPSSLSWGNNTILHAGNSSVLGNTININGTSTTWTDTKVTQDNTTTGNWRKLVLSAQNGSSAAVISAQTGQVYVNANIECQPSTGTIKSTNLQATSTVSAGTTVTAATSVISTTGDFYVGGTSGSRCHIKMDTTNKCIKFIFD